MDTTPSDVPEQQEVTAGRPVGAPRRLSGPRLAAAAGALLLVAAGTAGWAMTGRAARTPAAPRVEPVPSLSTTAGDTDTATPTPTLSPTVPASPAASTDPEPPGGETTAAQTTATHHATRTSAANASAGTHCNCADTQPTRNPDCHYDSQGRLITCSPVLTPTPIPRTSFPWDPYTPKPGTTPPHTATAVPEP